MKNVFYGLAVVLGTLGGLSIGPSFVAKPEAVAIAKPVLAPIDPAAPRSIEQSKQLLQDLHASIEANGQHVERAVARVPARRRAAWIGAGVGFVLSGLAVTLMSRRSAEDSKRSPVRRQGPALKLG